MAGALGDDKKLVRDEAREAYLCLREHSVEAAEAVKEAVFEALPKKQAEQICKRLRA